jgi:DNA-nicking Smr family endonuclease
MHPGFDDDDDDDFDPSGMIDLPIDGVLDLHTFKPRDVGDLIPDFLEACLEKGLLDVRIIHGKGTGALRKSVHALLERSPHVESFKLAPEDAGAWGATLVRLKKG